MSSAELAYWQEVARTEFIGDDREDFRVACIEAQIANYAGRVLKEGQSVNPSELMPFLPKKDAPKTPRRWTRKRAAEQVQSVMSAFRRKPHSEKDGVKSR